MSGPASFPLPPHILTPDGIDDKLLHLAQELACGVSTVDDTLEALSISEEEYSRIIRHPQFPKLLAQYKTEWERADNTPQRIKMKSQLAIEKAIPEIFRQIYNNDEPLNSRVAAVTALGKFAGLGGPVADTSSGDGFKLTINFNGQKAMEISKALPDANTIDGELA